MTLTTVKSPFCEPTNVKGMRLREVVQVLQRAAPGGQNVVHTSKASKKTTFDGTDITLGFEIIMPERDLSNDIVELAQARHAQSADESEESSSEESSSDEDQAV